MRLRTNHATHHMEETTGIDLAPMLDFVLNLLIFFIITAVFMKELGITVSRPNASKAEQKESSSIVIAISGDGQIIVDHKIIDQRSVRANIERLHSQRPDDPVVVAADQAAPTGILVDVIDQARQGGVQNVSIAASKS
ncbi:ExbD/TolR family protein [Nevskia soli]|uniref:ExbD/TolR family protein n=1 Tax=Nevskia soli TaxID=418856 RepID=UPI0004A6E459